MATPVPPLVRAAALGLCLGCLIGGSAVLLHAARTLSTPLDCSGWSEEQCRFEQELATGFARRQLVAGAALVLLGVALALPLRSAYRTRGER